MTEEEKLQIRSLSALMPQREIAKRFNVSRPFISRNNRGCPKYVRPPQPKVEQRPQTCTIRVRQWMGDAALVRGLSVEAYLTELAIADAADIRKRKIVAPSVDAAKRVFRDKFEIVASKPKQRFLIDAAKVQRVLHLHDEQTPVAEITESVGVSRSSVARIIAAHAQNTNRVERATTGPRRHGHTWGSLGGRREAEAEA